MPEEVETLDDGAPHVTTYDLYRVNGSGLVELETALVLAEGRLSGRYETSKSDLVTIERVRVRQIVRVVLDEE